MLYRCGLGRLTDTDRAVQAAVPPLAAPPVLNDTFYMDPAAYRVMLRDAAGAHIGRADLAVCSSGAAGTR